MTRQTGNQKKKARLTMARCASCENFPCGNYPGSYNYDECDYIYGKPFNEEEYVEKQEESEGK